MKIKNICACLSVCGLLWGACSQDKEIGQIEPLSMDYELPQGKSSADNRILTFYEQYGSYILYDYTDNDFYYDNGIYTSYKYELPESECVNEMLNLLDTIWFNFYPDEFLAKTTPYQIFLAGDLQNERTEISINPETETLIHDTVYYPQLFVIGNNSLVFSNCRADSLNLVTSDILLAWKNQLQSKLWTSYWLTYNYIDFPDEFFEVSDYVGAANTDPSSPDFAWARGFVEGFERSYEWYTLTDWSTDALSETSDLSTFLEEMVTCSSEEWAEKLTYPLVREKYDILRSYFIENYNVDLQKIGDMNYK